MRLSLYCAISHFKYTQVPKWKPTELPPLVKEYGQQLTFNEHFHEFFLPLPSIGHIINEPLNELCLYETRGFGLWNPQHMERGVQGSPSCTFKWQGAYSCWHFMCRREPCPLPQGPQPWGRWTAPGVNLSSRLKVRFCPTSGWEKPYTPCLGYTVLNIGLPRLFSMIYEKAGMSEMDMSWKDQENPSTEEVGGETDTPRHPFLHLSCVAKVFHLSMSKPRCSHFHSNIVPH